MNWFSIRKERIIKKKEKKEKNGTNAKLCALGLASY